MNELLPSLPVLAAFLAASLLLAVTPGPGVFYIVTRTLAQGRSAGLASVAGVALGNFGNAVGAAIGLAAVLAVSSLAFSVIKYAGAAYLIWLGLRALRAPAAAASAGGGVEVSSSSRIFRDGFWVALLNPKTAVFFAAFLPQFMNPAANAALQSVMLGAMFVAIASVTDTLYVLGAGAVAPLLARSRGAPRFGRYLTGGAFIGLGLFTALSGARADISLHVSTR